jgi:aryl-alcohol dehydrogenase-like predicted oxidoreductase
MENRNLGRTGLKVSELCMGTMQFGWTADEALSFEILSAAYEAGVTFLDTADIYSRWVPGNPGGVSEAIIGRWLKQSGISREQLVIATKVRGPMGSGPNDEGLSRVHIISACEASLRRLQTEYIDLYQTHWPDDTTPIEETLSALTDLMRQGKVRYIGCSNYKAGQLVESLWKADKLGLERYDCLQPHYNLIKRADFESELAGICIKYGIGVIPYSPLAGGFLTGKYRKGVTPDSVRAQGLQHACTDRNFALIDVMEKIAVEKSASISQIALAWLLSNPAIISPIIGPHTHEQLRDNLGAAGMRLSAEEKLLLNEVSATESS